MARQKPKSAARPKSKAKTPIRPEQGDQATVEEFEREGMGIAPKE